MARPLTYRRHGRHRSYDRLNRRTDSQASPGLGQDAQRFVDDQDARLGGTAEGSEGVFDSMHLEQGEDEVFTFDQVREAADPSDIGLSSSFTAQTQSINIPVDGSTDKLGNITEQAIGIANLWSIGVWWKPAVVPFASSEFLFDLRRVTAPAAASQISLYHDNSNTRLRLDWADTSGAPTEITAWNGIYTGEAGNWVHILITWTGTSMFMAKNGVDQGPPDVGTPTPSITMADDLRQMTFGNFALAHPASTASVEGNIAQAGIWNADVRAAAATIVAGGSGQNLNADGGAYTFSGNLAHWYRAGHEASPNLGKDFAEAGITPTISLDVDSVGITDGDRQADVP